MVKEYEIPPVNGDVPGKPSRLRIFDSEEDLPVDLGGLEREAFSYIGEWKVYMKPAGYGLAYRMASKEGVIDVEGDSNTVIFHFVTPTARRGIEMTEERQTEIYRDAQVIAEQYTVIAHQFLDENIVTVMRSPPEWMGKDLEDMLQ